jgi:hypothetical protein
MRQAQHFANVWQNMGLTPQVAQAKQQLLAAEAMGRTLEQEAAFVVGDR